MNKSPLQKFYSTKGYYRWEKGNFQHDRVKKMIEQIELVLQSKRKLRVLDIGSGTGDLLYRLYKKYPQHEYHGCDIADTIIAKNKKDKREINWKIQDFNGRTTYANDSFDLVIAGEILEHVYDTDNFMKEIHRVLKKNGIVILTTPNLASWLDRAFLLFGMQPHATEVSNISRKFGREKYYELMRIKEDVQPAGHLRCFTWGALSSMAEFHKLHVLKHIACYSHDILPNKLVTALMPTMSQNQIIVASKQ